LGEARTFVRGSDLKFQAYPGFFDDRLFAWAVTDMVARQASYITPVYERATWDMDKEPLIYVEPGSDVRDGNLRLVINTDAAPQSEEGREQRIEEIKTFL
jgi:hypothetical protein